MAGWNIYHREWEDATLRTMSEWVGQGKEEPAEGGGYVAEKEEEGPERPVERRGRGEVSICPMGLLVQAATVKAVLDGPEA